MVLLVVSLFFLLSFRHVFFLFFLSATTYALCRYEALHYVTNKPAMMLNLGFDVVIAVAFFFYMT